MPRRVAGEVQHEAVILALGEARAAADHLDVEAHAFRGAEQRDEVHPRRVEAGG